MAIELIEMGEEVEYIPIDASKAPYTFSMKLTDKTFSFTVKYNEVGEFYTVDLEDSEGALLAFGDPIRYGRPLFGSIEDERFPLPVIIPRCFTTDGIEAVTPSNLGKQVRLYLYERVVA